MTKQDAQIFSLLLNRGVSFLARSYDIVLMPASDSRGKFMLRVVDEMSGKLVVAEDLDTKEGVLFEVRYLMNDAVTKHLLKMAE